MPKIIDRSQKKAELAQKAAEIFSTYGYSALGMRDISKKLGLSKSALYHYYKSKQALFDAATRQALGAEMSALTQGVAADATPSQKLEHLHQYMLEMAPRFEGEVTLLLDYIKQKSQNQIRSDQSMQYANKAFENAIAELVGKDNAYAVTCLYYGSMLQNIFDGQTSDINQIHTWLEHKLKK